ncbi:helix-turn-helix domain-containing protein [Proteinivorax tanatarense]|uniref:Helix-turn-helix domain-containing protein n=1 Tax=Proteinivorax tanatarense TaxID=1260629 RepID=A0AAU7VM02_9FIRM
MRNEKKLKYSCAIQYTLDLIGGKWKLIILWHLTHKEIMRYGEIKRSLTGITHKMLSQQLKDLEADGFIHRKEYPQIPPKVEYSLTDLGKSLLPVLQSMSNWGNEHMQ